MPWQFAAMQDNKCFTDCCKLWTFATWLYHALPAQRQDFCILFDWGLARRPALLSEQPEGFAERVAVS